MFKTLILAALVAVSISGAILTSAIPASAEEGLDDAFDMADACGIGYHRNLNGYCVPN